MNTCFLCYDIPDRSLAVNPSGKLRRRAVRINLSCWVIREEDIPHTLLNDLAEKGATWYCVKFDADEAEHLVNLATDALRKDLAAAEKRAEESAERAEVQMNAALTDDEADAQEALQHYLTRIRATIKRAEKLAADLGGAARRFGIDATSLPLEAVAEAALMIRNAAHERAGEFVRMAEEAGKFGTTGKAIALAAQADDIPALIMADYIEENGGDTAKVRELFASV